jgi:hypothetical protein
MSSFDINEAILAIQKEVKAYGEPLSFMVEFNSSYYTPVLVKPSGLTSLYRILVSGLDEQGFDSVAVNAYEKGNTIYSETVFPKPEEPKEPEYETITLKGVQYKLVPVE